MGLKVRECIYKKNVRLMHEFQVSHRNAVQTALSSTQTPSIVLPKTIVPGSVHFKQTTKLGFMNLPPGSTVGMSLSQRL